jgi:nickel/cobalt exporter
VLFDRACHYARQVGAAAALSVHHATARWSWFGTFARRAPYFSSVLIIAVGLYVGFHGWVGIAGPASEVERRDDSWHGDG